MFYGLGRVQTLPLPKSPQQIRRQVNALLRRENRAAAVAAKQAAYVTAHPDGSRTVNQQTAYDNRIAAAATRQALHETQRQAAQAQAAAKKADAQAKQAERQGNHAQAQANRQAATAAKAAEKQATAQAKIDAANAAQQQAQQDAQNFQSMATQFPSPAVVPAGDPGFDTMFGPGAPTPIGANFGTGGPVDYTGDIFGGGVALPVQSPGMTAPAYPQYPQFAAPSQMPQQFAQPGYSNGLPSMPSGGGGGPLFSSPGPMQQPQFDDAASSYPETQDSGVQLDDGAQVPSQDDPEFAGAGVDSGDYSAGSDWGFGRFGDASAKTNWLLIGGAVLLGWYLLKKK